MATLRDLAEYGQAKVEEAARVVKNSYNALRNLPASTREGRAAIGRLTEKGPTRADSIAALKSKLAEAQGYYRGQIKPRIERTLRDLAR